MAKSIRFFGEFILILVYEYYCAVNFFSELKFEHYCEYYPEILLQESLK